jgi:signal transduction histidine kinase
VGRLRDALGIRLTDVFATVVVALVVDLNVEFGGGAGARPLNTLAYVLGAILALPVLLRRKWPLQVLVACSVLLLVSYISYRRNISPAPLLSLPLYDAALAGYLAVSIVIPTAFMAIGSVVVGATTHAGIASLANEFLPSIVVLVLAIMLGDTVRSRRALAVETAGKLRLAAEEREAETARRLAEERLRIARELHDTVAHSMATITVQAGSALHLLGQAEQPALNGETGARDQQAEVAPAPSRAAAVQAALVAIRETSKGALADMRVTLGQLRGAAGQVDAAEVRTAGLERLPALSDAVRAAGAPVSVTIEGDQVPLDPDVDHAAYRILQESLTNVLRHAGPLASAAVRLSYRPDALTIQVTDNGIQASPAGHPGPGHGLTGMAERAAAVGGELVARPRPGGGFEVLARLPLAAPGPRAAPDQRTAPGPAHPTQDQGATGDQPMIPDQRTAPGQGPAPAPEGAPDPSLAAGSS